MSDRMNIKSVVTGTHLISEEYSLWVYKHKNAQ